MQGNDLATYVEQRNVVILTPTLFVPPEYRGMEKWKRWAKREHLSADEYTMNPLMIRWITSEGYSRNMATEIWGFEPEEIFDDLCERVLAVADRYIFRCTRWDSEEDARQDMMANLPSITRVYDADPDRVDRLWQFNGYKVYTGDHP